MSGGTGGTGGTARIDAWVWSVRLFKTRSAAAAACKAGHVKLNDATVKPAQTVAVGDRVRAWVNHREYIYEVTDLVTKRVGAPRARECYIDHSPPPPSKEILASIPRRDRGAGRPTKRERRQLDKLRGMD
ncbi:MAG: RNA-binding S4 domain-containing protein [Corynebacterium sp.]|uniref:RNA-binding S4 domain-containing protein n=1 Tax=Corynebacterium TaxID=1716 RepID=UPI0026478772|nr:RNA-binding S4 domain-containing protein [Corynebacterium sp.]MDN5723747.1 RNA-binding S4 domain-containing protein [Corynebacterium sp.]MDN6282572.1 RNA-binding S4 domain-containing protein [Corynebacterium sp.]MDN6304620.1 RNA-binding S4 domain-containing protein [Corynebacterium sp.]MDN6353880.1 RNA-binding S4 domain-containing protein [Corynebacterium sp.]MDN6368050.1 RNA-binding S4 domain-containing protein [Corynebacterium sp.]